MTHTVFKMSLSRHLFVIVLFFFLKIAMTTYMMGGVIGYGVSYILLSKYQDWIMIHTNDALYCQNAMYDEIRNRNNNRARSGDMKTTSKSTRPRVFISSNKSRGEFLFIFSCVYLMHHYLTL